MTTPHRATPEQWAAVEEYAKDLNAAADSSCILELRARVEALEAQHETQRLATLAWGKDVDNHGRWIDDHLKRIMALEAGQRSFAGRFQPLRVETVYADPSVPVEGLVRDVSLTIEEAAAIVAAQRSEQPPADSLVERVCVEAGIHNPADARAAIREVAAALIDWHDSDQVVRTAWEAGKWLEREAGE